MSEGVFRWAWRRATTLWSGAATTFLIALFAWLLGRNLPCVLSQDLCDLLPDADGVLGHLLPPAVVLVAYLGVLVARAGVEQRNALRDAARKHDETWHPEPDIRVDASLHQHAEHGVHYRVEISNLPPGEYEAEGHAINKDVEKWRIPWGEEAAERALKPGGGTDMVRLAVIEWQPDTNRVEVLPFRSGVDRHAGGRVDYRLHRSHGYDGLHVTIRFELRGDSLASSYYEVSAQAWWDEGPHTSVEGTLVRNPLVDT